MINFHFLVLLLFYLLGLHTIPFGIRKTKRNLKKNSYPSGVIELSIRPFLNRLHVPKEVYLTPPKEGGNNNCTFS